MTLSVIHGYVKHKQIVQLVCIVIAIYIHSGLC